MAAITMPTITLKGTLGSVQPKTVVDQLAPQVAEFAKHLPAGYSWRLSCRGKHQGQNPIIAGSADAFLMATILMVQLQSFHRLFLVLRLPSQ
jgi:hypothetical protein